MESSLPEQLLRRQRPYYMREHFSRAVAGSLVVVLLIGLPGAKRAFAPCGGAPGKQPAVSLWFSPQPLANGDMKRQYPRPFHRGPRGICSVKYIEPTLSSITIIHPSFHTVIVVLLFS